MPSTTHHVYLIPGFFGFAYLGDVKYFTHVRDHLGPYLRQSLHNVELHYVHTLPTASLKQRTIRLLDCIRSTAGPDPDGPIHLIGHSSGGLDARMLVASSIELETELPLEPIASRVQTVTTVATPHRGTPLASIFTGLAGQQLLKIISLSAILVLHNGRLPLAVMVRLARLLTQIAEGVLPNKTVLDQIFEQLLGDFQPDRQASLKTFFTEVADDRGLLPQLTPEGAELLHATLHPRPGVRFGSVILQARKPRLKTVQDIGLDPSAQALHGLYRWLHGATSFARSKTHIPLSLETTGPLVAAFGEVPDMGSSDGIVPTRSQVWGPIIHAAWSDHLDAIGHFDDPQHTPPHFDWLPSGSHFKRANFELLWSNVARFIIGDEPH